MKLTSAAVKLATTLSLALHSYFHTANHAQGLPQPICRSPTCITHIGSASVWMLPDGGLQTSHTQPCALLAGNLIRTMSQWGSCTCTSAMRSSPSRNRGIAPPLTHSPHQVSRVPSGRIRAGISYCGSNDNESGSHPLLCHLQRCNAELAAFIVVHLTTYIRVLS